MDILVRVLLWIGATCVSFLVCAMVGMVITESSDDAIWPKGGFIAAIMILGASLTINLIQFGVV